MLISNFSFQQNYVVFRLTYLTIISYEVKYNFHKLQSLNLNPSFVVVVMLVFYAKV